MSNNSSKPVTGVVSVIINNYNYGRFLADAIESALAQSYRAVEVVVVDDGSTDNSRDVIGGFGSRVRCLLKPNGGQGSAYNLGFASALGEWIVMLDSDDTLEPSCIDECMAAVDSRTSKVQFRLAYRTGKGVMDSWTPTMMHRGDVTSLIGAFGTYAGPPGSGNFYRRSAIERAFPLPEASWRGGADTVPYVFAGIAGHIVSLDRVLGTYRLHAQTGRRSGVIGNMNATIGAAVRTEYERRRAVAELIRDRVGRDLDSFRLNSPTFIRNLVLAHRLNQIESHPCSHDALHAEDALAKSLSEWGGYSFRQRALHRLSLRALLHAPRFALLPMAAGLASTSFRRHLVN